MKSRSATTVPANPEPSSRERILLAAEKLFAARGYYGVTIREITREAGVDLALANYYFGPKEEMFRQVIMHRAEEHYDSIRKGVEDALARSAGRPPSVETAIRCLASPVLDKLARGGDGWRNYIRLLSYLSNSAQQQHFLQPMNEIYDPVMRQVLALLKQALPAATDASIARSFYLFMGSLIHVYSATGGIDRLTDGACAATDFDEILDHLVPFFAAGFYRMAER